MFQKSFKQQITDFHYGKFSFLLFTLLFVPSIFYFFVILIKNFLYKVKILKEKKVCAKVICVGNLTTGGVGKTPVVIEIANYLSATGKKVAILSRGYGGNLKKGEVHLIKKDGKILTDNPYLSGDEVNLIAHKTNGADIITSSNRYLGAKYAAEKLGAKVIITDDGFSNRTFYKDLTILLFDNKKLIGNGGLLPFGALREPVFEIKRANKILFIDKNGEKNKNLEKFKEDLKIPYFECEMKNGKIYNIKTGDVIENGNIIAFSGIGQPNQFYKKLTAFNIKKTFDFDDHIEYTQEILDKILDEAQKIGVEKIITTEKDAVKLLNFKGAEKIYALELKPVFDIEKLIF